jgi:uncharacterized protein (TIGR00266 family)
MSWYIALNGQQQGPFSAYDVQSKVKTAEITTDTLAWKDGMAGWVAINKITELTQTQAVPAAPVIPNGGGLADEIDYQIHGSEMQFVEIELDPGECAVAEAGGMMYMTDGITMDTVFGDGTSENKSTGFFDQILGAGKRLLTGESMFTTVFQNTGSGKQHVAFAAPYPGKIIPVDLDSVNRKLICQKDAFLCAAKGVQIGIEFQKKIMTGLFGGEGFIMQKLEGDGMVFLHAGGTIIEKKLEAGKHLKVDTGCIVAFEQTVDYDIQRVGGVKSSLFGGEGFFYAVMTGPGRVWLQSLPFSRMAGKIHEAMPQHGGSQGEGSVVNNVLGQGLGSIIGGN